MQPKQLRIFQLFAEAIIPLYGVFFANWSFSFLVYFYIIDLVSYTIVGCLKIRKVKQFQNIKETGKDYFGLISLAVIVLISLFFLRSLIDPTTVLASFNTFFFTKEMNIPQGFLLIPLLFFTAWQQYKMLFVKMRQYENSNSILMIKEMQINFCLLIAFLAIAFALRSLFVFPSVVIVLLFLVGRVASFLYLEKSRIESQHH
jgi:cation transport ATPase